MTAAPEPATARQPEADQEAIREAPVQAEPSRAAGHIDPAAAARYRQAQTELVGLIREEARTVGREPEAERKELLPDSLGDWMERRVAELEQAEADEPEIEAIG